jgi:hypothetical protein
MAEMPFCQLLWVRGGLVSPKRICGSVNLAATDDALDGADVAGHPESYIRCCSVEQR